MKNNGLYLVKRLLNAILLASALSIIGQVQAADGSTIVLSADLVDGVTFPAYKVLDINGQAPAGTSLDVKLVKDNATITMARVLVNGDGTWKVSLPDQAPGGPFKLQIGGAKQTKVVNDIYIGRDDYVARNPMGDVILSTRITDDMHLQPGEAIEINGLAEPGRTIDIKLIKQQQTVTMARVQTGRDGQWQVTMSAQKAGGPFQLNVTDGTHQKMLKGIIIGHADIKKAPAVASKPPAAQEKVDELAAKKSNTNQPVEPVSKAAPQLAEPPKPASIANQIKSEFLQQQFDDSAWNLVNLTSLGELAKNQTLIARKYVHFAIEPQAVSLSIGQENQVGQIYINGQQLDAKEWQQNPLKISVPSGMFHAGDNVIALVSINQWDNTRFIGAKGRFNITIDQFNLELANNWRVFSPDSEAL